ncbi:MAG: hypothetical protein ACHQ1H_03370, partial [Nitrososphaerales archaeon]
MLSTSSHFTTTVSNSTASPLVSFSGLSTQLQSVAESLDSRFNSSMDLVYESATSGHDTFTTHPFNQTYWISNDNTLAALALQNYYPVDAANISRTVNAYTTNYSVPSSDYIQVFWGKAITLPIHTENNFIVKNTSAYLVVDEIHNGKGNFSDWQLYENLVVVHALNNYINNNYTGAVADFGIAEKMWNTSGHGIADITVNKTKPVYSDYKLAYLIFLAHVLNISDDTISAIESTLWTNQLSTGGISVNYGSGASKSQVDSTNSETDASVLLAYDQDLISKIQHPVSGSVRLIEAQPGAPNETFDLSGCNVSLSSVTGNGSAYAFSSRPDCHITISSQLSAKGTRFVFDNGSSTFGFITCTFGDCGEQNYSYIYQLQENLSYWIADGSSALSVPTFQSSQYGSNYSQALSLFPNVAWLDYGASWSVSPENLTGSNLTQRWFANSGVLSGNLQDAGTISPEYLHQDFVTFSTNPNFGGAVLPSTGWFNATNSIATLASPAQGFALSKWISNTSSIVVLNPRNQATSISVKGSGTVTAQFIAGVFSSVSPNSTTIARGRHSFSVSLMVTGYPQRVTLSHGPLPTGITLNFSKTHVMGSLSGVKVSITIIVSSTAHV